MTANNRVRRQQKKFQLQDENLRAEAVALLLGCESGRRFLYNLLDQCEVLSYLPVDPEQMIRSAGRRDVGNGLLQYLIVHHPEAFGVMTREYNEEMQRRQEIIEDAKTPRES
jgi:hypothetical protein